MTLAEPQINRLLPGAVGLGKVTRIDLLGLSLQDARIRDPEGHTVLRIRELHVSIDPEGLLSRQLTVLHGRIVGPFVDLVGTGTDQSGLVAAFVDPQAPDSADSDSADAWAIQLDNLAIEDGTVILPGGALGPWTAQRLDALGSVGIGPTLSTVVTHLSAELRRQDRPLCEQVTLRGRFNSHGASNLHLHARAGSATLSARARATLAGAQLLQVPVSAHLRLSAAAGELAQRLDLEGVPPGLGALHLSLDASGTLGDLHTAVLLDSAAGRLSGLLSAGDHGLVLQARVAGVQPDALFPGAPHGPLSLTARVSTDVPEPNGPWPIHLTVHDPILHGRHLPQIEARAELSDTGLGDLALRLRGPGLSGHLHGEVDFAGRGELGGSLAVRDLGRLPLSAEPLMQGPAQLHGRARIGASGKLHARLRVRSPRLSLPGVMLSHVAGDVTARGPVSAPVVTADLALGGFRTDGLRLHHGRLRLRTDRRRLAVDGTAQLDLPGGGPPGVAMLSLSGDVDRRTRRLQVRGQAQADPGLRSQATITARFGRQANLLRALQRADYDARLELDLDTEFLRLLAPEAPLPVEGRGHALLLARGPLRRPHLEHKAGARQQHPASEQPLRLDLQAALGPRSGSAQLHGFEGPRQVAQAYAELDYPAGLDPLLAEPRHWLRGLSARADLDVAPTPIAGYLPQVELPQGLSQAQLSGTAQVRYGRGQSPALDVNLQLTTGEEPAPLPRATASRVGSPPSADRAPDGRGSGWTPGEARCSGAAMVANGSLQVRGQVLQVSGQARLAGQEALSLTARAETNLQRALASGTALRVRDMAYSLALPGVDLAHVPVLCTYGSGHVSGSSRGHELTGPNPRLDLTLKARDLRHDGHGGLGLEVTGRATRDRASVRGQLLHDGKRSPFSAVMPIRFSRGRVTVRKDAPLNAELSLLGLSLDDVVDPTGAVSQTSGQVRGQLMVGGTIAAPVLNGQLSLHDVALTATALSQPLHGISGEIVLRGRELVVPSLIARDQDGKLILRGNATLPAAGSDAVSTRFHVHAEDFPVRSEGQVAAEANLDATVQTVTRGRRTTAELILERADVWILTSEPRKGLSLAPHPDIVDPLARNADTAPKDPAGTLSLRMRSRSDFWVKRDDFAIKLSAEVMAEVDERGSRLTGNVTVERGYVQLVGQTFTLSEDSRVIFTGSQPPNPALDMTATAENRRAGKTVTLTIKGRADAPELVFQVDGKAKTAGDAMQALVDSGSAGGTSTASREAESFVRGVLGGVLAVTARRELGAVAPILMIEAGDSQQSARVRAGFELDPLLPSFLKAIVRGAYLEGTVGDGESRQPIDTGVLLELYFPHQLVGVGKYGPGNTWSVDLFWEPK